MELKKLEALEERIRKAASALRALKQENTLLAKRIAERDEEVEELRAKLEEAESAGADEETLAEIRALREERGDILNRVDKMLGLLDEVESLAARQEDLLAAVDGDE